MKYILTIVGFVGIIVGIYIVVRFFMDAKKAIANQQPFYGSPLELGGGIVMTIASSVALIGGIQLINED